MPCGRGESHGAPAGTGTAAAIIPAAVLLLLAVLTTMLGVAVAGEWPPLVRADAAVARTVAGFAVDHAAVRTAARAVTHLGDGITRGVVTAAAVLLLLRRRAYSGAALLAVVVPLGGLISTLTKGAFDRPRPVGADPVYLATGGSFPSGHAMGAMVICGALLLVGWRHLPGGARRPAAGAAAATVLAVGASRVVLGVHYPSDVAGGWLFGLLLLAGVAAAFGWAGDRRGRGAPAG